MSDTPSYLRCLFMKTAPVYALCMSSVYLPAVFHPQELKTRNPKTHLFHVATSHNDKVTYINLFFLPSLCFFPPSGHLGNACK